MAKLSFFTSSFPQVFPTNPPVQTDPLLVTSLTPLRGSTWLLGRVLRERLAQGLAAHDTTGADTRPLFIRAGPVLPVLARLDASVGGGGAEREARRHGKGRAAPGTSDANP